MDLAAKMPDVADSIQLLKQRFTEKGLNEKDLVVLSGNNNLSLISYLSNIIIFMHV